MSKIMSALVASTMALASGAAMAATAAAPAYADLDLGRPKDAQAYSARVNRAVDRICERESGTGFNAGQQAFACQARTRQAITASLPEPVRSVYLAALQGQASDVLTRQRLAAGAATSAPGAN